MSDATKRCPECGEEILAVARKCKHCGSEIGAGAPMPAAASSAVPLADYGSALLILPVATTLVMLATVLNMSLIQGPGLVINLALAIVIVVTATLAAIESSKGRKASGISTGNKPAVWFIGFLLLWLVAYPWYMAERAKFGLPRLLWKSLAAALFFIGSVAFLGALIEDEKTTILEQFDQATAAPQSHQAAPPVIPPTTAEAAPLAAPALSDSKQRELTPTNVQMVVDELPAHIEGELQNPHDRALNNVVIIYTVFDDSGAAIGEAMDSISAIPQGAKWKFKAIALTDKRPAKATLQSVTTN